jgi:hypothetical protein
MLKLNPDYDHEIYRSIRKDERDTVLDELEKNLRHYDCVRFVDVMCEIDKLRQQVSKGIKGE